MEKEMVYKIYTLLQKSDLNWHSWHWWAYKDKWFAQFKPEQIDAVAMEMAMIGMIETNGHGFRRKEKSFKEKFWLKFFGYEKEVIKNEFIR